MSASPDNRFLAIRAAAQEATEFAWDDAHVARFIGLRDAGADRDRLAHELAVTAGVADELIRADEAYAVAHRIAIGELAMYPPPEPQERVVDTRVGSGWVPIGLLMVVLVGVIAYALAR